MKTEKYNEQLKKDGIKEFKFEDVDEVGVNGEPIGLRVVSYKQDERADN